MAAYLHNILPMSLLSLCSLYQLLFQIFPTYDHLGIFGCLCYLNLTSTQANKLLRRLTPPVFFVYSLNHEGYQCYCLETPKVIISGHVSIC